MTSIKEALERMETASTAVINLDNGGAAVKFRYDGEYVAFLITGDGSDMNREMERATWENKRRYILTVDRKNVGTWRAHGGKVAVYTKHGCIVFTNPPEDYLTQLNALGYREVFGGCPVPGSGCGECVPIGGIYLH